ncbi:hypothetical protein NQ317_018089 [Molorchus minor]|uniref:Small ribosomal subunit protein uS15m n=1 Tax=Molorchus minor TaxID=1323400 RepID=A0ABQ9JD87_9CUCU|nr:hypothetical protein NQ317_018089 [Molorchus minor]
MLGGSISNLLKLSGETFRVSRFSLTTSVAPVCDTSRSCGQHLNKDLGIDCQILYYIFSSLRFCDKKIYVLGIIRAMQETLERFPRNKRLKVDLKELIDRRKKFLKRLRRWDYKKFEWVLENLDIVYKPPPNKFHWVTRKESLQKLTNKYANDLKQQRLDAYRLLLESEQPVFLEEKIRSLNFIRDEQKGCGVEVTVLEEEIEAIKRQLKKLKTQVTELPIVIINAK